MAVTHKNIVFPEVPHDGELGLKLHDTAGNVIFADITPTTWTQIWDMHCEEWAETAFSYEENPGDFYYAWHYLDKHPAFWKFRHGPSDANAQPLAERLHVRNLMPDYGIDRCVNISVVKINPETRSTEEEPQTETEIWIELGQQSWPVEVDPGDPETYDKSYNDYMMECGGPTVETAMLRAAHNVWQVYGNDRRVCDGPYDARDYATVLEPDEFDELLATLDDPGEVNERVRRATQRLHEIVTSRETR